MLHQVGLNSAEELFDSIPKDLRLSRNLNTPAALSEIELLAGFEQLATHNRAAGRTSFLGAGAYQHYIPTIVDHIISRSEFFTAYTPYQPEISQGTLQAIFEFQTLVCQLTGMEVANASMYDGSTALAEAGLMAERVTRRSKVVACGAVHPEYLEVVRTYVQHAGIDFEHVDFDSRTGSTSADFEAILNDKTAAIVVQSPNFFGCIEDVSALAEKAHATGALLIVAVTEAASLYLETMGRRGLQEVAQQCAQKAAYAARRIREINDFSLPFSAPRFNEFVVRGPLPATELLARLASDHNINGGLALSRYFDDRPNEFLVCVTETNSRTEIDALVDALKSTTTREV